MPPMRTWPSLALLFCHLATLELSYAYPGERVVKEVVKGFGPIGSRAQAAAALRGRALLRDFPKDPVEQLPTESELASNDKLADFKKTRESEGLQYDILLDPPMYHSNEQLEKYLQRFAKRCSNITHLSSFGRSVEGRTLWALEIADKPNVEEAEPYFKFVGNMHGDEPTGRELILRLAEWLCKNYKEDPEAKFIVDNVHLFLLPTLNPDGFAHRTRENVNNIDLNRDFPDQYQSGNDDLSKRQPETLALINFTLSHRFTAGASLHEGALLANYPWDGTADGSTAYSKAPDDEAYKLLAKTYANGHSHMSKSTEFKDGITNGAAWYPVYGGMQDWNYLHAGCMDITIEANDFKWPPAEQLPQLWEEHKNGMLKLVALPAKSGLHGTVKSATSGDPLPANISIAGIDHVIQAGPKFGDFFRILVPGTYTVGVSMEGYKNVSTVAMILPDVPTGLDFELEPLPEPLNTTASNTTAGYWGSIVNGIANSTLQSVSNNTRGTNITAPIVTNSTVKESKPTLEVVQDFGMRDAQVKGAQLDDIDEELGDFSDPEDGGVSGGVIEQDGAGGKEAATGVDTSEVLARVGDGNSTKSNAADLLGEQTNIAKKTSQKAAGATDLDAGEKEKGNDLSGSEEPQTVDIRTDHEGLPKSKGSTELDDPEVIDVGDLQTQRSTSKPVENRGGLPTLQRSAKIPRSKGGLMLGLEEHVFPEAQRPARSLQSGWFRFEGMYFWLGLVVVGGSCVGLCYRGRRRKVLTPKYGRLRTRIPQILRHESTRL